MALSQGSLNLRSLWTAAPVVLSEPLATSLLAGYWTSTRGLLSSPGKGSSQVSARVRSRRDCAPDLRIATSARLAAIARPTKSPALFAVRTRGAASGFVRSLESIIYLSHVARQYYEPSKLKA